MSVVILTAWMFLSGQGFTARNFVLPDMETCQTIGHQLSADLYGQKIPTPDGKKLSVEDAGFTCTVATKAAHA